MDALEQDLRDVLRRQVATPPAVALADVAVRRGRAVRRRRTVAGALAVAAVVSAGAVVVAGLDGRDPGVGPAASLAGPPRGVLSLPDPTRLRTVLLDWPDGAPRERELADTVLVVASTPDGVVLVDEQGRLALLRPAATVPDVLLTDVGPFVAVAPEGDRAVVVTGLRGGRVLREVALPSGQVLRSLPAGTALLPDDQTLAPVAYTDAGVLLGTGEGDVQGAVLWEPGDGGVVGRLDGPTYPQGGAGGRAALTDPADDRCRVQVVALRTGGDGWRLCREPFAGFSPDGRYVLSRNAVGDALLVRDARDGALVREIEVEGSARGYAWESSDALLVTTVEDDRTVVLRCAAVAERCTTATSFPFLDRIPLPVTPRGAP